MSKKFLVHVHIFYVELWPELAAAIRNIDGGCDLYVTLVKEDAALRRAILADFPQAKILLLPNIGWDLLPFLKVIRQVDLSQYDYVIKLHTKKTYPVFIGPRDIPAMPALPRRNHAYVNGTRWRDLLLRFLRSKAYFEQGLQAFEEDPALGMIADSRLFLDRGSDTDHGAYEEACLFLRNNGYPVRQFQFVAGTMFIARACIFTALQKIDFRDDMFDVPKDHETRTFAHVMERVLGAVVYAQGYKIRDIAPERSLFYDFFLIWFLNILSFFFQYRETASGYRMIKIFKIPVWHRKITRK